MNIDYTRTFCCPVPKLAHNPSSWSAYFNAPGRDGYNPNYRNPGDPEGHGGVDLHADLSSPSLSPMDGTIMWAGSKVSNWAAGRFIETVARDDENNGWWLTRALHHDEVLVEAGETVKAGQIVGRVGKTGQASLPHVHFEIHWLTLPYGTPGNGVSMGVKLDPIGDPQGRWPGFGLLDHPCPEWADDSWPLLLRRGDRHPTVRYLRGMLYALGYMARTGNSDYFGGTVRRAVLAFQETHGLKADGIVGPVTVAALYAAIAATE